MCCEARCWLKGVLHARGFGACNMPNPSPAQAYVLPRLYPAILWNAAGVQHLGLHRFEDYCLTELPPALVPSVKARGRRALHYVGAR